MFKVFLKIILAFLLGGVWYYIDQSNLVAIAVVLAVFVFLILVVKPIKFQSPKKREEFIQQMREKRERLMAIELKQKEEIERARKLNRLKREQHMEMHRENFNSKFKE
ncbi:hypothetical protein LW135_07145 [Helicobacter sp. faydin-H20]|uniref:hypothetical protein n=1 Tax=Helicobacter anatolicus TaxID=2905874 RepID=UPI001E313829|nr:hypothetical protein [Helicobacter anatolicus]MCE3037597.1 hypothetical protein [Helicobacter anatolicus]